LRRKWKGGEPDEGASGLSNWCTARLGASSSWRVGGRPRRARREGVPRGEAEKLGRSQGRDTARARRVSGCLDSAGAKQGREREKRERVE
jgi:hypothetical protein